ncbi:hopanoid biosynthesis-associated protein HpnK [Paraburkholderia oxyphila]|uniref:hopanoid biosynthesis-associated protein HpnK n=1 Tax=Paraburkholderia oxyphila TaxID=614212 RepID=UPI001FDEE1AD|nr:hopanoid biosynthesis-associated protein HpnK [Paraburkholderia oxyphila]
MMDVSGVGTSGVDTPRADAAAHVANTGRDGSGGRALIFTADDFGLHERVNAAVERAHRDGVLNAASLMVAAPAAADAVARARRLPNLRVGLHLVLADGAAMLPRTQIPALVDAAGRFGDNMVRDGVRFFFLPHVRAQLAKEIRAQFEAFAATGLALDHVNTHKHFHLHPTVLALILSIGREYGLRAMRLPLEAGAPFALKPWLALVRARLARAGVAHNDYVVGIAKTGAMDEAVLLEALAHLPAQGVGEIYCHPAEAPAAGEGPITPSMRTYRHADELGALISPRVAEALKRTGVRHGGFTDVFFGDKARASTSGDASTLATKAQATS